MDVLPEVVTTPRLTLRVWRLEDAPALAEAVQVSREHLVPWMPWASGDASVEHYEAFIGERRAHWAAGGDATYGVFAGGAVAGGTGLHRRRGPGVLEIGYWVHVDYIGRGYATEISASLTDAAFCVEGIDRVEIRHDGANLRSRAVPRRLGFTNEGELAGERKTSGDAGVDWVWAVTRNEWTTRRPAGAAGPGASADAVDAP